MDAVVTLIGPRAETLDAAIVTEAARALNALDAEVGAVDWLAQDQAADLPFSGPEPATAQAAVRDALGGRPIDIVAQPLRHRRKRLMLSDMDATMVAEETLDEVAAEAGLGERIAAITRRAMAGEMDFPAALMERIRIMSGVEVALFQRVLESATVNPGAEVAIRTMVAYGCHTILVTGGFDLITRPLAERIGFQEFRCNTFEIEGGRLTGRVVEPIFGRDGKAATLIETAAAFGLDATETLAVGDGANDAEMIRAAGLGVAYRGKDVLRQVTTAWLDHADLTGLLFVQGYRQDEFVRPD